MDNSRIELVGNYSAKLSLIEVALGSVLHAFYVPFAGQFLSLNQGFFLCRASMDAKAQGLGRVAYPISNVAAVLKSLAPAGKKLGPMLSLSMQGLLFTLGELLLGSNLAGWMLGMALLSLWTFVQPILTYYLFFGDRLVSAFLYLADKILPWKGWPMRMALWVFVSVVIAKILAAICLAWIAWRTKGKSAFQEKLFQLAQEKGAKPSFEESAPSRGRAAFLALKDLFRPLFLLSLAATAFFVYFAEHSMAERIWIFLRPLAIGFIFFYFSRTLTLERWLSRLHGTRGEAFARACQRALSQLKSG